MPNLRDESRAANEENFADNSDYNAQYGYDPGPGFGTQGPENITSGQGSGGYDPNAGAFPEQKVNLGSLYQPSDPDVMSGWTYGGDTPVRESGTPQRGAANSPANYNTSMVKPFGGTPVKSSGVSGGGIRGGVTARTPIASVQSSKTVFPSGAKYPTFAGPTWDERKIKAKTSKLAAPGIAALEMKVSQAMARYYENPNVRRMVLRDTLAGYGIGLANVRAGAARTAQAEYGQEYARMYSEAMGNFNRELGKLETQATKVTSQQPVYTQDALTKLTGVGDKTLKTLA